MKSVDSVILPHFIFKMSDINIGIILIGLYFIFEFGSVQGLYPIINKLKLPYVLSLISVFYAVYLIINAKFTFQSSTTKSFVLLCFFVIGYSYLTSRLPEVKIDTIKLFLFYLTEYVIIVSCIKKPSQFILLIDIWLVSVLFSSYHGIMQGGLVWGNRWLKDQNHISLVVATAIPFALVFYKNHRSQIKRICYVLCVGFYIAVNVVAASRGGTLSLMVAIAFSWLLYKNKIRNAILISIAFVIVINYAPEYFFKEMGTLAQGTQEETADDRIYLWRIAIDMFKDHPIIGVGIMNYPVNFLSYEKGVRYTTVGGGHRVAHSTPLQWLAETGIVGVVILLLLQVALYNNWKNSITWTGKNLGDGDYDKTFIDDLSHACAISQVGFWFGAIFLTLLPYPFYWCLVPFSEAWKNITINYVRSNTDTFRTSER